MTSPAPGNLPPPPPDPRIEQAAQLQEQIAQINARNTVIRGTHIPTAEREGREATARREASVDTLLEAQVAIGRCSLNGVVAAADWVGYRSPGLISTPNTEHRGTQDLQTGIPFQTPRYRRERFKQQQGQGWNGSHDVPYSGANSSGFMSLFRRVAYGLGHESGGGGGILEDHTALGATRAALSRGNSALADLNNEDPLLLATTHRPIPDHGHGHGHGHGHHGPDYGTHAHYGGEDPHDEAHQHRQRRGNLHYAEAVAVVGAQIGARVDYMGGQTTLDEFRDTTSMHNADPDAHHDEAHHHMTDPEAARQTAIAEHRLGTGNASQDLDDLAYLAAHPHSNEILTIDERLRHEAEALGGGIHTEGRYAGQRRPGMAIDVADMVLGIDDPAREQQRAEELAAVTAELTAARAADPSDSALRTMTATSFQELAEARAERQNLQERLFDLPAGASAVTRRYLTDELAQADSRCRSLDPTYDHLYRMPPRPQNERNRSAFAFPADRTTWTREQQQRHNISERRAEAAELASRRQELLIMLRRENRYGSPIVLDRQLREDPQTGETTSDFRITAELAAGLSRRLIGTVTMAAAIDAAYPRGAIQDRIQRYRTEMDQLRIPSDSAVNNPYVAQAALQTVQRLANPANRNPYPGARANEEQHYQNSLQILGIVDPASSDPAERMQGLDELDAMLHPVEPVLVDDGQGNMIPLQVNGQVQMRPTGAYQRLIDRQNADRLRLQQLGRSWEGLETRLREHIGQDGKLAEYQMQELGPRVLAQVPNIDGTRQNYMAEDARRARARAEQVAADAMVGGLNEELRRNAQARVDLSDELTDLRDDIRNNPYVPPTPPTAPPSGPAPRRRRPRP